MIDCAKCGTCHLAPGYGDMECLEAQLAAATARASELEKQVAALGERVARLEAENARLLLATPGGQAKLREQLLDHCFACRHPQSEHVNGFCAKCEYGGYSDPTSPLIAVDKEGGRANVARPGINLQGRTCLILTPPTDAG